MNTRARRVRGLRTKLGLFVVLVAAGALAAATMWQPDFMIPVLLAGTATLVGLLFVLFFKFSRRTSTHFRNLIRRMDTPAPAPAPPAPHEWRDHSWAARYVESGVFSQEFYERSIGLRFSRAQDAAAHYLTYQLQRLLPPNPFVELNSVPSLIQSLARRGRAGEVLNYLTDPSSLEFGPAFDPESFETDPHSKLSPLGQFLTGMHSKTLLPVSESSPLSGVPAQLYADRVTQQFQALSDERKLRQPREKDTWDAAAELAWKKELFNTTEAPTAFVSIIMPVKNREDLVGAAIASIQEQTYESWELFVVDDHSTDGTLPAVREIAKDDPRITVLSHEGSGVSAARNAGMDVAAGEYLAFLDSDNTWKPDFLDCMLRGMIRSGAGWGYSANQIISETQESSYLAYEGDRDHLLFKNHIDLNIMIVDAGLISKTGGFDETLRRWVDYDLVLRLERISQPVLLPFIGCIYDHSSIRSDRITVKEPSSWQAVVHGKHLLDWDTDSTKERVQGRVSVVLPTFEDSLSALEAVESILDRAGLEDIEIVVIDTNSSARHARRLIQDLSCRHNVRLVRLFRNFGEPIARNLGYLESTGELILFIDTKTRMRAGSLASLVSQLHSENAVGVNPLLLKPNDTISSAGLVWAIRNSLPLQFLEHHPREDADRIADYSFSAARTTGLLMRSKHFEELRGFDPFFVVCMADVDLTLRASHQLSGGFKIVPDVSLTCEELPLLRYELKATSDMRHFMDRWRESLPDADHGVFGQAGFEVLQLGADSILRRPETAGTRVTLGRPAESRRRWAIKNPAAASLGGDQWGDTHFIDSFAQSLRRIGQDVVTFRRGAHAAPSNLLDDVSLVIRGRHRSSPIPGKLNILWIISHPDKVTKEELEGFDLVYAASAVWARWATDFFGLRIRHLLQATDHSRFSFSEPVESPSVDVVFVGGNFAERERKAVLDAVEAGVNLKVYGPGWAGVIPHEMIGGEYVPNDHLADVYRDARFVLADHWNFMAQEGFIQNRLFDAVASGCRVISDDVSGLREIFSNEVLVSRGPADIKRIVDEALAGDDEEAKELVRQAAQRVRKYHTFDARAQQMLADVEEWERSNRL